MNSAVNTFNSTVSTLFDLALAPFSALSSEVGLIVVSAISGVVLLLIYGRVSNQKAIANVKRRIYAFLLESILFRHNIKLSLKAQGKMLWNGFLYFCYAIPPILVLMIPTLVILAQLNLRYESRGFDLGEPGVVKLKLSDPALLFSTQLRTSDGLTATPPLRIPESKEIFWRVSATKDTPQELTIDFDSKADPVSSKISIGRSNGPIFAENFRSWWWNLLYPSQLRLTSLSSPIEEFSIGYPSQSYPFFGFSAHWLVVFAVVSILSGIIASRIFGVEI